MDSILDSIKQALGLEKDYTFFDVDIIMGINSALATLRQIGVEGGTITSIEDSSSTWEEFLGREYDFEAVKSYVYLKTRLFFDPPTMGALIESTNKLISELEWRIMVNSDPKPEVAASVEP